MSIFNVRTDSRNAKKKRLNIKAKYYNVGDRKKTIIMKDNIKMFNEDVCGVLREQKRKAAMKIIHLIGSNRS